MCEVAWLKYNCIASELQCGCRNIKHAFYQPAENEMICLVHFHLINPIMVAKKKTQDVQCYAEVMDSVQTLDAGRRSMYDPDEIEEEQREREQRNKVFTCPNFAFLVSVHVLWPLQSSSLVHPCMSCPSRLACSSSMLLVTLKLACTCIFKIPLLTFCWL